MLTILNRIVQDFVHHCRQSFFLTTLLGSSIDFLKKGDLGELLSLESIEGFEKLRFLKHTLVVDGYMSESGMFHPTQFCGMKMSEP